MARKYTGKVVRRVGGSPAKAAKSPSTVSIELDGDIAPKVGDNVTLSISLTNEQIGEKFRRMFDDVETDSITDLCDNIENYAGWPMLADLIKDVVL